MGNLLSGGSEDDYKQTMAVERHLELVAQNTGMDVEELRELHTAFLAQYPTGYISPQQFVDENTEAIGGPPELWQHYFNFIAVPPLTKTRRPAQPAAATSASAGGQQQPPGSKAAAAANRGVGGGGGGGNATAGVSSVSERLAAANRGNNSSSASGGSGGMRTSLVTATDPTEDLDLDPRVVGLSFSHVMIRLHRSVYTASEQKLKHLFAFFDVNQDGLISHEDLETAFTWLFQVPLVQQTEAYDDLPADQRDPAVRAETLLRLWDRDGDGLLNQDEFVEMGRADPDLLALLTALRK